MKLRFAVLALLIAFVSTVSAQVPASQHVVVVVEENHDYSQVIGTGAMPYLSGLANQYGLATQYYANTHPSIGNYFMMTTGQIITNNDNYNSVVTADNLVRHLRGLERRNQRGRIFRIGEQAGHIAHVNQPACAQGTRHAPGGNIHSLGESLWWSVTTVTTVFPSFA